MHSRRFRTLRRRWLIGALAFGVVVFLAIRWLERPPEDPTDACAVFRERPSWYASLRQSEESWGTPKGVQLAILFHESSLRARARPPRRRILRIIPWRRPSTAYGYGQILDGTWRDYRRSTGRPYAKRWSFHDVADFVGWYTDRIHRSTGVSKADAYGLYLAYHEGPGGYVRGTHRSKPWLLGLARRVAGRADSYETQLARCEVSLRWALFRLRCQQLLAVLAVATVPFYLLRLWDSWPRRKRRR